MDLALKCFLVLEHVALCYNFSTNSNSCSVKPRGIETMFWAHWEPQGRYVWSVRETGCVSPLVQRVFCYYSELLCVFAEQVQICQNMDVIDFID
jgi:hypothetical protein